MSKSGRGRFGDAVPINYVASKLLSQIMPNSTEDRLLFIVRMWREDSQAAPGGQWRGSIEHAPSGQRAHFVSLDALAEFVSKFMNTDTTTLPTEGINHDK
jgi:hypothetical protein